MQKHVVTRMQGPSPQQSAHDNYKPFLISTFLELSFKRWFRTLGQMVHGCIEVNIHCIIKKFLKTGSQI